MCGCAGESERQTEGRKTSRHTDTPREGARNVNDNCVSGSDREREREMQIMCKCVTECVFLFPIPPHLSLVSCYNPSGAGQRPVDLHPHSVRGSKINQSEEVKQLPFYYEW